MSFSQEVKQEIAERIPQSRKACIAYLSAMFRQCGRRNGLEERRPGIQFQTENLQAARICFTLLKKTFNIYFDVCVRQTHADIYIIRICGKDALEVSESLYLGDEISAAELMDIEERRAYIAGSFMCSGSMSDPSSSYHFEIVCMTESHAEFVRWLIDSFDIDGKIVLRKKYYVVYIKEGSQIVDILNVMEAHVSLMNMENLRIVKDVRNSVNRRVNCETANISKTVSAAVRQVEDIKYIERTGHLDSLNEALRQMAEVRLEYPELPLKDLGEMLDPPVGKSGVNHRLRKLSEIADDLRNRN